MDLFNDPFFIGFNRELGRLSTAHKVNSQAYPPYDLLKLDEDTYRLSVAIAGFTKEDINVSIDITPMLSFGLPKYATGQNQHFALQSPFGSMLICDIFFIFYFLLC